MTRRFVPLLLLELTLFVILPGSSKASCLVCCGRHAAANILRLSPSFSSSSTILFETNAGALNPQSWQESQQGRRQLYYDHIRSDVVVVDSGTRRNEDATVRITNMQLPLSSYVHNTNWKHPFAGKDLLLLIDLGEDEEDNNIDVDPTPPPRRRLEDEKDEETVPSEETTTPDEEVVSMTTAMVASIGFYKRFISPL
jgi:hypothetical protein